jgi:hypothetical protein
LPALGVYDLRSIKRELPFTQPVYDPVVTNLRKVFTDIPYASFAEVKLADPAYGQIDHGALDHLGNRLQPKDFVNQLVNRGFNINDVDQVTRLFNARLDYDAKIFVDPDGNRLISHELLFATSRDGQAFVRLRQAGLDKMPDNDSRYKVEEKYTLCRRANLVVLLELSSISYRRTIAGKRWGFSGRQIGV